MRSNVFGMHVFDFAQILLRFRPNLPS